MNIKAIRDRAWHYITPTVAAEANMSVEQLKQFVIGSFSPSAEQLNKLAQRMGIAQQ